MTTYHRHLPAMCALLAVTAAATPGAARAADLDTLISSLYGGDGVTLATTPIFNHAAHFTGDLLLELEQLSAKALDLSIPLPSGDGGAVFVFDPVFDDFFEAEDSLGTLFSQRAGTLGKGRSSFGFGLQDIRYKRFEGDDLDRLQVALDHQNVGGPGIDTLDQVLVDIDLSLFSNHGITDNWKLGLIVPLMDTRMQAAANARVNAHPTAVFTGNALHNFDPAGRDGDMTHASARGDHRGIGDMQLRRKYALSTSDTATLALSGQLRLPTGDASNLQGVPGYGGQLGVLYCRRHTLAQDTLSPHANLRIEFNSGRRGQERLEAVTGLEYSQVVRNQQLAFGVDVMGTREVTNRDGIGDTVLDAAVSPRWKPNPRSNIYLGLQLPLNRNHGLRADLVSHIGLFLSL